MSNCFKLYQKNNVSGEKYLSGKVFFRKPMTLPYLQPLCKTGPSVQDVSPGTDARKAGGPFFQTPLDPRFFSFISLLRIGQPRGGTRAQQRGLRQGRGLRSPAHL